MSNEIDRQGLSRDPEVVRAYNEDSLVHDRLSARLGMDMLEAGLWALEHAAELPLPLLLMHGSADRLCSAQASREFAAQAGDGCTLKIWDGFYHEIHNEPEEVSREHGDDLEEYYYWYYREPETTIGRLRLHGLLFEGGHEDEVVLVIPTEVQRLLADLLKT